MKHGVFQSETPAYYSYEVFTMKKMKGPGQPPLPYKTKTVRIPVDLEENVKRMVEKYKKQARGA
jgi:hypothetical protein